MFRNPLLALTGLAAVVGLMAAPVGPARAQDHGAGHGHHHADFESGRFHVRVDGEGRDIILIPGLGSSPEVWQGTVDHLGAGYRVHRIHIQGFAGAPVAGNTDGAVAAPVAEELARYIAEQGLQKPAVVGHSMGGSIGMMLAARHPDVVGKLMVVDMVPFLGATFGAPGVTVESVTPVADQIHASMNAASDEQYQAMAAANVATMVNTDTARPAILADTAESDRRVSTNAFRELVVTDLRPELPRITAPTRVLYVKFNDPRMTAEITDSIYRASFATLPSAGLKRIDDSAHFLFIDQPAAFYAELDAFLAE